MQLNVKVLYLYKKKKRMRQTLSVVHAHGRVVIDCRIPQESVIRIVSTMGTKESISYKMISHGSWYRQIDKEKGQQQPSGEGDQETDRRGDSMQMWKQSWMFARRKKEKGE